MSLWSAGTEEFAEALRTAGLRRAWIVHDASSGRTHASHPLLDELVAALSSERRDYDAHRAIFFETGAESGHLSSAFIHRTARGQAAGGVRFWSYTDVESLVRDGLRLSRGMGRKSALAGLWWSGGKGVIARRPGLDYEDPELRARVFRDYGRFLTGLCGCYVTAEDVGTRPSDIESIYSTTRHTTCIPPKWGGSGNPSILTARGVVVAMQAALDELDHGSLAGKTVAMQGLGHVSLYMIGELLRAGVTRIVGTDIDTAAIARVQAEYPDARLDLARADPGDHAVLAEACDILAPNAVGGTLNPDTIPAIRAPIVCGAANNPLEDPLRDARALASRDILNVPDFVANRMGIVNCANEQYGVFRPDPAIEAHLQRDNPTGVYQRCREVFGRARRERTTPVEAAQALADELLDEPHPLWGDRCGKIIGHLVGDWAG